MNTCIKFLGVGGISTLLQYAFLIIFVEVFKLKPVVGTLVLYIFSAMFNYFANYYVTFLSGEKHIKSFKKFVLIVCIGLLLSGSLMHLFTEWLNVFYLFAQVVTTLIVLVWNFLSQKNWVFKG